MDTPRTNDELFDTAWQNFDDMIDLGYEHFVDVSEEKGDWRGESAMDRWRMISGRLSIIGDLIDGVVLRNDNGTLRTLKNEYAKLICSVMILGDDLKLFETKDE